MEYFQFVKTQPGFNLLPTEWQGKQYHNKIRWKSTHAHDIVQTRRYRLTSIQVYYHDYKIIQVYYHIIIKYIIIYYSTTRIRNSSVCSSVHHTAWAPEGRSQAGPKCRQLKVGAQRAIRLLFRYIIIYHSTTRIRNSSVCPSVTKNPAHL